MQCNHICCVLYIALDIEQNMFLFPPSFPPPVVFSMKFGFVTFDNAKDAYRAIDCSTRDETINMYDVSFGGRRAFCKSTYLDLGIYPIEREREETPKHSCL